jgi:phosphate transport system ATP-binding protein
MSIKDNVMSGIKLSGISRSDTADLVEVSLKRAAMWNEVKDRLSDPAVSLSGGQQQRLCIARSLAMNPDVLLMDEPCSALDPGSTRRIEETILELKENVTIVIVTHNMQQAQRISDQTAFFLAEDNTPGYVVEFGETQQIFYGPIDPRTNEYVNGRFG